MSGARAILALAVLTVALAACSAPAQSTPATPPASAAPAAAAAPATSAPAPTHTAAPAPAAPAPAAIPAAPAATMLTFEVTSNKPLTMLSYTDGSANPAVKVPNPPTSWTKTVPFAGGSVHLAMVSAGTGKLGDGSTITCKVSVNGVVKVQNTTPSAAICVASW